MPWETWRCGPMYPRSDHSRMGGVERSRTVSQPQRFESHGKSLRSRRWKVDQRKPRGAVESRERVGEITRETQLLVQHGSEAASRVFGAFTWPNANLHPFFVDRHCPRYYVSASCWHAKADLRRLCPCRQPTGCHKASLMGEKCAPDT